MVALLNFAVRERAVLYLGIPEYLSLAELLLHQQFEFVDLSYCHA